MTEKRPKRGVDIRGPLLAFGVTVLTLMALEVGVRLRFDGEGPTRRITPDLGWETKQNLKMTRTPPGYGDVSYSTVRNGFRLFGDLNGSWRILVLGDSYTQAREVSDGQAYYDVLDAIEGVEVFAYGSGGYGSLQEYMILDRFVDEIRPDLVLWQFSPNDIINNSWELESRSAVNNNHMTRPYLEDGRIRHRYPSPSALERHSLLARWVFARMGVARAEALGEVPLLFRLEDEPELLAAAVATTNEVMGMVRKRVGDVPVAAFAASDFDWVGDSFVGIARNHQIYWIDSVPVAIGEARDRGIQVDGMPRDPHWNATGHAIAGQLIATELWEVDLLGGHAPQ